MSAIKIACAKCGQRVSGDERFFGTTVQCPICSSEIRFPDHPDASGGGAHADSYASLPRAFDEPAELPAAPRPQGPPPGSEQPQPYQPSQPQPYQAYQPSQPQPQQQLPPQDPYPQPPQQVYPPHQPYPQQLPGHQLPGGPLLQPGLPAQPGMPQYGSFGAMPMPLPIQPQQSEPAPGTRESSRGGDSGVMPWVTLITGILSLLSCSGIVIGPAAIIIGHLTLIRLDDNDKAAKMKTTIGLILGYVSLILLLIVVVGLKLGGVIGGAPAEQ